MGDALTPVDVTSVSVGGQAPDPSKGLVRSVSRDAPVKTPTPVVLKKLPVKKERSKEWKGELSLFKKEWDLGKYFTLSVSGKFSMAGTLSLEAGPEDAFAKVSTKGDEKTVSLIVDELWGAKGPEIWGGETSWHVGKPIGKAGRDGFDVGIEMSVDYKKTLYKAGTSKKGDAKEPIRPGGLTGESKIDLGAEAKFTFHLIQVKKDKNTGNWNVKVASAELELSGGLGFESKRAVEIHGTPCTGKFSGKVKVTLKLEITPNWKGILFEIAKDYAIEIAEFIGEEVLVDTGISVVVAEIGVDGAIAIASSAAAVALIIFVGYEVGKSFKMLAEYNQRIDLAYEIQKNPEKYVAPMRDTIRSNVMMGFETGLVDNQELSASAIKGPIPQQAYTAGVVWGNATRKSMSEAMWKKAENQKLGRPKFDTLFAKYMLDHRAQFKAAKIQSREELIQLYTWWHCFTSWKMPTDRVWWDPIWRAVFNDFNYGLDENLNPQWLWENPKYKSTVAGVHKNDVVKQSLAWLQAQ